MVHGHGFFTFRGSCITLCETYYDLHWGVVDPVCEMGSIGVKNLGVALLAGRQAIGICLPPPPTQPPRLVLHPSLEKENLSPICPIT